jgi:hypothetical protein
MARLNQRQKALIQELTTTALYRLLTFHVSFSSLAYVHDQATDNWRELEEELHQGYPIRGAGILATRRNLRIIDANYGGFLHTDEDLYPSEVPAELQAFPYDAASAAYAFTLLEGYGDDVLDIVNPEARKRRQAWHHAVYGDADLRVPAQLAKAKKGFANAFGKNPKNVPRYTIARLVKIKAERNQFMHEGTSGIRFSEFYGMVLATVASVYFLVLPSESSLSAYPYEDYHNKFLHP